MSIDVLRHPHQRVHFFFFLYWSNNLRAPVVHVLKDTLFKIRESGKGTLAQVKPFTVASLTAVTHRDRGLLAVVLERELVATLVWHVEARSHYHFVIRRSATPTVWVVHHVTCVPGELGSTIVEVTLNRSRKHGRGGQGKDRCNEG